MKKEQVKKKNLLLMVPSLSQGGFERVCVKTARLLEDDYDVTMVIFDEGDAVYDVSGIRLVNLHLPPARGVAGKVLNVMKRAAGVKRVRKENAIDLSYSFGMSANLVNVFSRGRGKTLTGLRCQTDLESPRKIRLFCDRSDLVLSCSREIMRQLRTDFRFEQSRHISNPLDVDRIRAQAAEAVPDLPFAKEKDIFLICAMARDDYIKGLWHLVKAFSLLHGEHENARLMIIGAGSYAKTKKLCEDLGVAKQVAFPGVRKNPFPYVAASDLYVLSSNHEGFPNALLEAMALGKPVIAADCKTGPREIVLSDDEHDALLARFPDGTSTREIIRGAYGILVPDMSETEDYSVRITDGDKTLYEAMRMIRNDPQEAASYGERAGERARDFTPERYRAALVEILEQV